MGQSAHRSYSVVANGDGDPCIIRDGVSDVGKGLAGGAATDATDIDVLSVAASVAFLRCGDDAPAAIKDEDDVISSLTPSIRLRLGATLWFLDFVSSVHSRKVVLTGDKTPGN